MVTFAATVLAQSSRGVFTDAVIMFDRHVIYPLWLIGQNNTGVVFAVDACWHSSALTFPGGVGQHYYNNIAWSAVVWPWKQRPYQRYNTSSPLYKIMCLLRSGLREVVCDGVYAMPAYLDWRPTERVAVNGRRWRVAVSPVETLQAAELSRQFDEIVTAEP